MEPSFVVPIAVTHAHITAGIRSLCTHCPVALALQDALNDKNIGYETAYAVMSHCYVEQSTGKHFAELPLEGRAFIHNFDNYGMLGVEPFECELTFKPCPVTAS